MNSYPSRNQMVSATTESKDAGVPTSHTQWFRSYFPVPKTTAFDLSQDSRENRAENDMEIVRQNSTNQSPLKALKPKTQRMKRSASDKSPSIPETKRERKNLGINVDISSFDVSGVPPPVCSCTGVSKVCYKWGMGGWQSSCCTIDISSYPLPMSIKRPGSRLAGRKMSHGAYAKLLMRLAGEGNDLSQPVDLRNHWARHGTNKFVTIK